jgi:hypothetical protein
MQRKTNGHFLQAHAWQWDGFFRFLLIKISRNSIFFHSNSKRYFHGNWLTAINDYFKSMKLPLVSHIYFIIYMMMGVILPIVFCKKQHSENCKPNFRGKIFLAILKYTLHAILKTNIFFVKSKNVFLKYFLIGQKTKSFWANFCTRNAQTPRNIYYA